MYRNKLPDQQVSHLNVAKLCIIGIGRFIGGTGQYWNAGFIMGKYPYLATTAWYGFACVCLALCLAELVSALPFTGGLYGYIRGLVGPYYGFLAAVMEVYTNVCSIALFLIGFGVSCTTTLGLPSELSLAFYFLPFLTTGLLHRAGKKAFWHGAMLLTILAIMLVLLYIFSSFHNINFGEYHANSHAKQPSAEIKAQNVINWQGAPVLFFVGEYLLPALVAYEEDHSPAVAPKTIIITTVTVAVLACVLVYVASLQYPGATALIDEALPLNYGFSRALGIPLHVAAVLNIPMFLSSFVIAMYYLVAMVKSMASSGIFPSRLLRTDGPDNTPWEAMKFAYIGALLLTLLFVGMQVAGPYYAVILYTLCTFHLYTLWILLMVSYIYFRKRFHSIPRRFRSPFGVYGAYIAIFSAVQHFLTQFYPFQEYIIAPLVVFLLTLVGLTYIYARFVIKCQKYSEEEERIFFITYIITANRRTRERVHGRAAALAQHNNAHFNNANNTGNALSTASPSNNSNANSVNSFSLRMGTFHGNNSNSSSYHRANNNGAGSTASGSPQQQVRSVPLSPLMSATFASPTLANLLFRKSTESSETVGHQRDANMHSPGIPITGMSPSFAHSRGEGVSRPRISTVSGETSFFAIIREIFSGRLIAQREVSDHHSSSSSAIQHRHYSHQQSSELSHTRLRFLSSSSAGSAHSNTTHSSASPSATPTMMNRVIPVLDLQAMEHAVLDIHLDEGLGSGRPSYVVKASGKNKSRKIGGGVLLRDDLQAGSSSGDFDDDYDSDEAPAGVVRLFTIQQDDEEEEEDEEEENDHECEVGDKEKDDNDHDEFQDVGEDSLESGRMLRGSHLRTSGPSDRHNNHETSTPSGKQGSKKTSPHASSSNRSRKMPSSLSSSSMKKPSNRTFASHATTKLRATMAVLEGAGSSAPLAVEDVDDLSGHHSISSVQDVETGGHV